MADKQPRIVAELGRPETPEETAARKAENSRQHRANQTLRNLIYSLIATLAVVLVLVAVVVRPDPAARGTVDYEKVAADAQVNSAIELLAPALGAEWTSNDASLTTGADEVQTWYVGFITPKSQYIGFQQGIGANPTWVAQQLTELTPTGTVVIDGTTWDVYDHRDAKDPGNFAYSMVLPLAEQSLVLHGTAETAEFETLATELTEGLK